MNPLVLSMSSVGHCIKDMWATEKGIKGKPFPAFLASTADEGNLHEDAIKVKLRDLGFIIEDDREDCKICVARDGWGRKGLHREIDLGYAKLIGHMDGRICLPSNAKPDQSFFTEKFKLENIIRDFWYKLEIKSMSQNEFYRWMNGKFLAFPQYADQLTTYGIADNNEKSLYFVKNRNLGNMDKLILNENPSKWNLIKEKIETISYSLLHNTIIEAEYDPESLQCQRCGHDDMCIPEPKDLDSIDYETLSKALNKITEISKQTKQLESEYYKTKELIINFMKSNNKFKMRFGDYALSLKLNVTRTSYPKDNLLKAGVSYETLAEAANTSEPKDNLWMKNLNEE